MKKQPKLTHMDLLRIDVMVSEMLVQDALKWNEQEYEDLRFEMGMQWMERNYVQEVAQILRSDNGIWNWWKLKYREVDREFLDFTYEENPLDDFERFYRYLADRMTQSNQKPPYDLEKDAWRAYSKMITDNKVCR